MRLAAIEPEYLEDGTEVETHRALGHVALDAPAILSGVLSVSALHAERRVEAAVLLAADGPEGSGDRAAVWVGCTRRWVPAGWTAYRAGVVAAGAGGCAAAGACHGGHLVGAVTSGVEDGAHLRRRCRRALARISPELLLERAQRARAQCGSAAVGGRAWGGPVGGDLPLRGRGDRVGGDRRPGAPLRQGRRVHAHRGRPRQGSDRPGGRAGDHRHRPDHHRPGRGPPPRGWMGTATRAPRGARSLRRVRGSDDLVEVTGPAGNQPVFVSRAWVTAMAAPDVGRPRSAIDGPSPRPRWRPDDPVPGSGSTRR